MLISSSVISLTKEPIKDGRVILSQVPGLKALSSVIVVMNGQITPSFLHSQFHRSSISLGVGDASVIIKLLFHMFSRYTLLECVY